MTLWQVAGHVQMSEMMMLPRYASCPAHVQVLCTYVHMRVACVLPNVMLCYVMDYAVMAPPELYTSKYCCTAALHSSHPGALPAGEPVCSCCCPSC